ncbi:uncharacterized protein LOC134501122 [Candoia aspera]|uniref:uncharacterized protein LOC134501122 n=1 Tax=Candoia aspera TaxID=51853 RepID=UPI002FD81FE9
MAKESKRGLALPADKVLALAHISLVALSLSLLGSGSILAVAVRRRRCCCDQLRPLVLLSLADFLGAAVLISTLAVHLLPNHPFGAAHRFCLYGLVFGMMFYTISLLMVLVYACEVNRAVRGWRVTQCSNTQENSSCFPRVQLALPYVLVWLLPGLVVLALLVLRSGSLGGMALLQPSPQAGKDSSGGSNLSCSSCLILIHLSQDTCYEHSGKESNIFFLVFVALVVSGCVVSDVCGLSSSVVLTAGRAPPTRQVQPLIVSPRLRGPVGRGGGVCFAAAQKGSQLRQRIGQAPKGVIGTQGAILAQHSGDVP